MAEKNPSTVQTSESMSPIDTTISHAQPVNPSPTWPGEPQSLIPTRLEKIALGVWDAVLILMAFALLVKAILVGMSGIFNGLTVSTEEMEWEPTRYLIEFNGQMITLFTIVFITIMSTVAKRWALWKAERGATLAELEYLQGSVSMVSALKMTWLLRSFRVQSLLLLFVWCFYYIGSQAAKEELKRYDSGRFVDLQNMLIQRSNGLSLFDSEAEGKLRKSSDSAHLNLKALQSETNVAFGSIFLSAESKKASALNIGSWSVYQSPTVDTECVDDYSSTTIPTGWRQGPKILSQPVSYQDLPLFQYDAVNRIANITAVLGQYSVSNVSYFWINCDQGEQFPVSSFPNVTYHNASADISLIPLDQSMPSDIHGNKQRQIEIWYRGMNGSVLEAHRTICNLSTRYFDLDIVCSSTHCLPSRTRLASGQDFAHATTFATPFNNEQFLASFWGNMSTALGYQDDYLLPNMANSRLNPWQKYSTINYHFNPTNLFNTYYRLSQISISVRHAPQVSSPSWSGDEFFSRLSVFGAKAEPQTRVSWPWFAMDVLSALILLVAASASAWFRARTIAPDMLGYVSSLTRNNPDLILPTEGSTLGGLRRARMLKDVKVKIGAITGPDGVARIGLTTLDAQASPLQKGVKYV